MLCKFHHVPALVPIDSHIVTGRVVFCESEFVLLNGEVSPVEMFGHRPYCQLIAGNELALEAMCPRAQRFSFQAVRQIDDVSLGDFCFESPLNVTVDHSSDITVLTTL